MRSVPGASTKIIGDVKSDSPSSIIFSSNMRFISAFKTRLAKFYKATVKLVVRQFI